MRLVPRQHPIRASYGLAIAAGTGAAARTIAQETGLIQAFKNFKQAKAALGKRPNSDIHHIVEQCQAKPNRSGFPKSQLNSTDNLIRLPEDIHNKISAYYSSSAPGGGTVRDTLNGLSFQEQHSFGMDVVQQAINGTLK